MAVVVLPTPPLVFTTAIFKTRHTSIYEYRYTSVRIMVYTLIPNMECRGLLDTPFIPRYRQTASGAVVYTIPGLYRQPVDLYWKPTAS